MVTAAALMIIAGFIAGNLLAGRGPVWPAIALYWLIVTVRYLMDLWRMSK